MFENENLANIRVNEAIQQGVQSQKVQRTIGRRKKWVPGATLLLISLIILMVIFLAT
jgi:hypothetical protein